MPPLARSLPRSMNKSWNTNMNMNMSKTNISISRLRLSQTHTRNSAVLRIPLPILLLSSPQHRALSTTASHRSAASHDHDAHGGHESHYDPPSGWLWGVKPGEKYVKEGWEGIWYWGFFGSLGLGVVGYAFKPDTSIQTWALEEARRRLEVEGILKEPESK